MRERVQPGLVIKVATLPSGVETVKVDRGQQRTRVRTPCAHTRANPGNKPPPSDRQGATPPHVNNDPFQITAKLSVCKFNAKMY